MKGTSKERKGKRLPVLRTGDPNSAFHHYSAREILSAYGYPRFLLSSSAKSTKCTVVNVLTRILYMTPGVFCPHADSCLANCLGHTSGRMHMQDCVRARDQRTALYIEWPRLFMQRLQTEMALHAAEAQQKGLTAAVRLNGTGDIPWERRHGRVFECAPDMQFFDYTKSPGRMRNFLAGDFPKNYHLTFSIGDSNHDHARQFLESGGTVAVVFWPKLPRHWWGVPVLDGDVHDARFLDAPGRIVGLLAKGVARVDLAGFVIRPCPACNMDGCQLELQNTTKDSHRYTVHSCPRCGYELSARWIVTDIRPKTTLRKSISESTRQLPIFVDSGV